MNLTIETIKQRRQEGLKYSEIFSRYEKTRDSGEFTYLVVKDIILFNIRNRKKTMEEKNAVVDYYNSRGCYSHVYKTSENDIDKVVAQSCRELNSLAGKPQVTIPRWIGWLALVAIGSIAFYL